LHGLDEMEASIALQLEDAKGQTQPNSRKGDDNRPAMHSSLYIL
jgi:hypothetical protein